MSAKIYLVRHGRTALNAQGRLRGRDDPPLDERGWEEAAAAARQLAGSGIAAVYTSPLLRSVQTAETISGAAGVRTLTEGRLIDLDHGSWTALTPEEAAEADPEAFSRFRQDPGRAVAPGGEALQAVEQRVFAALAHIAEVHEGAAAAVSHEIPIRLVIARLTGTRGPGFWDVELPTGSVTLLGHDRGGFSLAGASRMGGAR